MSFEETGIDLLKHESFIHHIIGPLSKDEMEKFNPLLANQFINKAEIADSQSLDSTLQPIINQLSLLDNNDNIDLEKSLLSKDYFLLDGILCKYSSKRQEPFTKPIKFPFLICISSKFLPIVIGAYHIMFGHAGADKVYSIMKHR